MNFIQSIFEIALFLLAVFFLFYLPGKFLLIKLKPKLTFLEDLFMALTMGMLSFTLLVYLFSWLKVWVLVVPILLLVDFLALKSKAWPPPPFEKKNLVPFFLVLFLSGIFSLTMTLFGVYGNSFLYRGDDLWHLALVNELKAHFPPDHPGLAGISLRGYHYFYNLLLARVSQITHLSSFSLYFHFFPLLLSFLWGTGIYALMRAWSKKEKIALWAVFLTFFGGSFSFILNLQGHPGYSLDDAFGITQPTGSLINPPFTISIVFIITILFSLYRFFQKRQTQWLLPLVLAAGLISMFKVYAGMIVIGGLTGLAGLELIKKRYAMTRALFLIGVLFLLTYWILADRSASLLFHPLWAPHKVLIDHLPWYGYEEKHYTYSKFLVIQGLIKIELYGLTVFLIGSLGTRIFGFFPLLLKFLKNRRLPSPFAVALIGMSLVSILTPLFFLQTGKVFEIIQMAWYFLFFCSLFAAFGLVFMLDLIKKTWLKTLLILIFLLLTFPSAYEKFSNYLDLTKQRESLSSPYFKAMDFLKSQGSYDSTVLQLPPVDIEATEKGILDWYGDTNPAIIAFSNKRAYLADEYIDFSGTDVKSRAFLIEKIAFFNKKTSPSSPGRESLKEEIVNEIKKNKISYIYSPYSLSSFDTIEAIDKIYENEAAAIYQVNEK